MNTCEVSERAKKAPDQRKRQRVTSRTCELANEPSAVCPGQRVNAHVRLLRKDITDFTIRSPHVELPRGRFATAEDATAAVNVLDDHGYVRARPQPERQGPGRRPSPGYDVHPNATESTQSTE